MPRGEKGSPKKPARRDRVHHRRTRVGWGTGHRRFVIGLLPELIHISRERSRYSSRGGDARHRRRVFSRPAAQPASGGLCAAAVIDFCGAVDEFWAWIPTRERFAEWFGLGAEAAELYARHWDVDLQMVRSLVQPWPEGWPDRLLDLNAAAAEAGVEVPPRAVNHLHPRVHAEWNRELFKRISQSRAR